MPTAVLNQLSEGSPLLKQLYGMMSAKQMGGDIVVDWFLHNASISTIGFGIFVMGIFALRYSANRESPARRAYDLILVGSLGTALPISIFLILIAFNPSKISEVIDELQKISFYFAPYGAIVFFAAIYELWQKWRNIGKPESTDNGV